LNDPPGWVASRKKTELEGKRELTGALAGAEAERAASRPPTV
jgi:hypothetical protein